MMKYPRSRAIRLAFSILLLVLILLMLGYALYNLSNLSPDSIQTEEVLPSGIPVEVVASIVGAIVGVVGLMVTSMWNWREDRRREKLFEMQLERQRFEIEKLKLQLDLLRGEPNGGGQSQLFE
jgi:heme/copper-type cytochrome/quinol oxidase subunit 2